MSGNCCHKCRNQVLYFSTRKESWVEPWRGLRAEARVYAKVLEKLGVMA